MTQSEDELTAALLAIEAGIRAHDPLKPILVEVWPIGRAICGSWCLFRVIRIEEAISETVRLYGTHAKVRSITDTTPLPAND